MCWVCRLTALGLLTLMTCETFMGQSAETTAFLDRTMRGIAERRLTPRQAVAAFDSCRRVLEGFRQSIRSGEAPRVSLVFPLKGRNCSSIPFAGRGYSGASAYSFFDGNGHRGHPALDLFIPDRNFDSKDDRTGRFVDVVSISDGLVVSVTRAWTGDSLDAEGHLLRGGICVWMFDPVRQALLYYAHLANVQVRAGEKLRAGSILGQLGRTGKNAARRRSSTHLHIMCLSLKTAVPTPRNLYDDLCRSSGGVPNGTRRPLTPASP